MKKCFTFLAKSIPSFVMLFLLTSSALQAQVVLTVNAPSGVAGEYEAVPAAFGVAACDIDITGDLLIVDDGSVNPTEACTAVQNDLTGFIAIIDRGSCEFGVKCLNAQNAGAIAAIVCTNSSDALFSMGPGEVGDQVTIPSIMITQADCQAIRATIPDANVTIGLSTDVIPPSGNVYFEETFDEGPNGWASSVITGNEDEGFRWDENGIFSTAFGGTQTIQLAGALCTGAMGIPAGWYQTGMTGDSDNIPSNYNQYVSELISPTLDLSEVNVPLALEFTQVIQRLNIVQGQPHFSSVFYSLDDGDTWSDAIIVNPELETNSSDVTTPPLHSVEKVGLPAEILGQANVRIKFRWACDFYYWVIDNVRLVDREQFNLAVNPFFAIPQNAKFPASQVEPIYFMADVANIGSESQDDVNFNINIVNSANEVVYDDNLNYGTIAGDETVENTPFNNSWTPAAEEDIYVGTYTISSDNEDFNPDNDMRTFEFEVTANTFSKTYGELTNFISPAASAWDEATAPARSWGMGNHYHIVNDMVGGQPLAALSATIGISNEEPGLAEQAATGAGIEVLLYKWEDNNSDRSFTEDELSANPVGFNTLTFDGDGMGDPQFIEYEVEIFNFLDINDPVLLEANTDYILMVRYTDTDPAGDMDTELVFVGTSDRDYDAQNFLNGPDVLNSENEQIGLGQGDRRYATILFIPEDGDFSTGSSVFTAGFSSGVMPLIDLNIGLASTISTNELSDDNIIAVSPNPASESINLSLDLVETADDMTVYIMNASGQVVREQKYSNVQQNIFTYDVSSFAPGSYFISIITDAGVKMEKFVVQR